MTTTRRSTKGKQIALRENRTGYSSEEVLRVFRAVHAVDPRLRREKITETVTLYYGRRPTGSVELLLDSDSRLFLRMPRQVVSVARLAATLRWIMWRLVVPGGPTPYAVYQLDVTDPVIRRAVRAAGFAADALLHAVSFELGGKAPDDLRVELATQRGEERRAFAKYEEARWALTQVRRERSRLERALLRFGGAHVD